MTTPSTLLEHPLATAELLVVDTETNGRAGAACEPGHGRRGSI